MLQADGDQPSKSADRKDRESRSYSGVQEGVILGAPIINNGARVEPEVKKQARDGAISNQDREFTELQIIHEGRCDRDERQHADI